MTELDLWNHLWMASGGQGAWFLALGFLSWVGLRAGQNIYNNSDTPVVMKLAGTVFCLFIAQGWVYNFAFSEWNANGVANAMKSIADAGETLSPYAIRDGIQKESSWNRANNKNNILPNDKPEGNIQRNFLISLSTCLWLLCCSFSCYVCSFHYSLSLPLLPLHTSLMLRYFCEFLFPPHLPDLLDLSFQSLPLLRFLCARISVIRFCVALLFLICCFPCLLFLLAAPLLPNLLLHLCLSGSQTNF